jgi:hypothetical protein
MSATATPTATPRHPSSDARTARKPSAPGTHLGHDPAPRTPQERGGVVLFRVSFVSAMSDCDLALLARLLDLSTHMYPKMHPDPSSPGVARLDHFSGLFLNRGATAGQWVLEARTWGHPAPQSVHEWNLLAIWAARQLDPSVTLPRRLPAIAPEIPTHPVARFATRPLARIRRHIVGLQ